MPQKLKNWKMEIFGNREKSKKLAIFRHFLKLMELLSNITDWQHIKGGSLAEMSVGISASNAQKHSIFICGADFSGFDKINNFWQQNQLLLFLSNIIPKVLIC